ncbi:hypothetical protein ABZ249_04905 [Nocardiopsis sp. NPDC006139]|uniref:hypothetical protein n=1 Tax=Nocardiopsis sp. NPDC006139 TaxID=3154578 RepID=UPI0015972F6E|nr:hypothetical protein HUT17_02260 [Nocardiopsis flavescens]
MNMDEWVGESLQGVTERMFDLLILGGSRPPIGADANGPPTGGLLVVDEGVLHIQNIFNPLVLFLATLGILLAAVRLLWTRRLDPMMDLVRGLLSVIITTFAGLFLVYVLMAFGSALTQMIIDAPTYQGQRPHLNNSEGPINLLSSAREVYPSIMRVGADEDALGFDNDAARQAFTNLVSLAVILGLIAQMVILSVLNAIVYLLACLLPLAAASTMVPGLRIFPKVIGWLFACILYKPLLLMIYLVGLVLLGTTGDDTSNGLSTYLVGAGVMLLATGSLPVLMRLMGSAGVWMVALTAGGIGSITGGGGGSGGGGGGSGASEGGGSSAGVGGGTDGSPASYSGGSGGLQAAAAGANERASGVARNLDGGSGGGVQQAGDSGPATGAADRGALGTLGGQGGTGAGTAATAGLAAAGAPEAGGALDGTGDAGLPEGTGGDPTAQAGADSALPGGSGSAAPGASESVGSTTSASEASYVSASGAVEGGGGGGADPGAPGASYAGGGDSYGGSVSEGASLDTGGSVSTAGPGGAAGADAPTGADGRMV